jgi:hypothetical protein
VHLLVYCTVPGEPRHEHRVLVIARQHLRERLGSRRLGVEDAVHGVEPAEEVQKHMKYRYVLWGTGTAVICTVCSWKTSNI